MSFFKRFEAIILSTDDLAVAKAFYRTVFNATWAFEDDVSAMFEIGPVMIGLLSRDAAGQLTAPVPPGHDGAAPRTVFTLRVTDADTTCSVSLTNGYSRFRHIFCLRRAIT